MKTSELNGAALDWAVAKCEDILHPWGYIRIQDGRVMWITPGDHENADQWHRYSPSTDWAQGGQIIERELISIEQSDKYGWIASRKGPCSIGPTPLVAAMRCYVARKLGDELQIPKELQP